MNVIALMAQRAGLSAEGLSGILGVPLETAAELLSGELQPTVRQISVVRGLAAALKPASRPASCYTEIDSKGKAPSDMPEVQPRQKKAKLVTQLTLDIGERSKNALRQRSTGKKGAQRLTTVELCAGGGGAALGLEHAGFTPLALMDNDRHACATLRLNRPYWNVIEVDLKRFEVGYWRGADLVSGGLPCPPFSIAGKQLGEDDERDLFPSMLRIVKEVQPRAVLIENVRALMTDRFAYYRNRIDGALYREGFDTYWMGFNAVQFGVPQTRFRAFLVALRRGETSRLDWPIAMTSSPTTVADAIGDLMGENGWKGLTEWRKLAAAAAPTIVGGSKKHGGPDLGPTRARREWAQLGVDGLGLADAAPTRDFVGMPRLTIPMVARLQSFPLDWRFAGSKTHAYRQVGNALPVGLAASVAKAVRNCLS